MNAIGTYAHPCGRCYTLYYDYRKLVEHLYWAHGGESLKCDSCDVKKWQFAKHICHVLPNDNLETSFESDSSDSSDTEENVEEPLEVCTNRESEYCYCGKIDDGPMIGCDNPQCALQWYHFHCVAVTTPPDGDWFCPECTKLCEMFQNKNVDCIEVEMVDV